MLSEEKKIWKERVLRLAEKYGPFVRFYPEGPEGTGEGIEKHDETPIEDDSALDSAIKTSEKAEKSPEEQSAIDKARLSEQQLEQEKANTARAKETARQAQSEVETAKTENEQLKEQLAAAEAKAAEAGIKDVELDESKYEGTDLALVKSIKTLNEKIDARDKRIAGLEKKAAGYEEQTRKDAAVAARNTAYEELLTDLDTEYGADCRNEAVEKFNKAVKDGELPKGTPAKATRLMEKCYKEVKAAKSKTDKDKKDKSSLSLDSGSGGGSSPNLAGVEIREGSLEEVDAQVAKTTLGARKS